MFKKHRIILTNEDARAIMRTALKENKKAKNTLTIRTGQRHFDGNLIAASQ